MGNNLPALQIGDDLTIETIYSSWTSGRFRESESVRNAHLLAILFVRLGEFGNRPNTVSESTVSSTELSELLAVTESEIQRERELSEFLSAYKLCAKANSPSFS